MREAGLSVQVSRSVRVPAAVVRAALTRALRDAGFDIVSEHVTLVQGRRGSQLAGAVVKDKLPVQVELRFGGEGDGCRLDVDLRDRWRTPAGRVYGLQSQYEHVFAAVLTGLDAVLAELAPDTAGLGTGWSGQGEGAQSVLDRANASLSRVLTVSRGEDVGVGFRR